MGPLAFDDLVIGGDGYRFADLLCVKRTAFSHEAEVRLLFQDVSPSGVRAAPFSSS
jgi:hypothetical protein